MGLAVEVLLGSYVRTLQERLAFGQEFGPSRLAFPERKVRFSLK